MLLYVKDGLSRLPFHVYVITALVQYQLRVDPNEISDWCDCYAGNVLYV